VRTEKLDFTRWGVRVAAVGAIALAWFLTESRNASLRAEEAASRKRAVVVDELRRVQAVLANVDARLPEAGAGDAAWWKDRLTREAVRHRLDVARLEDRPSDLSLGQYRLLRRELELGGTFDGIHRYLAWLEGTVPAVRLERFSIEPGPGAAARLKLVLLLPSPNG
jgi:hypothetical protein